MQGMVQHTGRIQLLVYSAMLPPTEPQIPLLFTPATICTAAGSADTGFWIHFCKVVVFLPERESESTA
jgi:hypothetical protein